MLCAQTRSNEFANGQKTLGTWGRLFVHAHIINCTQQLNGESNLQLGLPIILEGWALTRGLLLSSA